MTNTFTIAVWGRKITEWHECMQFFADQSATLEHPLTHFGLSSDNYSGKSIRKISNWRNCLEQAVGVRWISALCLPNTFQVASRDYDLYSSRSNDYLCISFSKDATPSAQGELEKIIENMKVHQECIRGECFYLSKQEVPLLYVGGAMKTSQFTSLEVIKTFE